MAARFKPVFTIFAIISLISADSSFIPFLKLFINEGENKFKYSTYSFDNLLISTLNCLFASTVNSLFNSALLESKVLKFSIILFCVS